MLLSPIARWGTTRMQTALNIPASTNENIILNFHIAINHFIRYATSNELPSFNLTRLTFFWQVLTGYEV